MSVIFSVIYVYLFETQYFDLIDAVLVSTHGYEIDSCSIISCHVSKCIDIFLDTQ